MHSTLRALALTAALPMLAEAQQPAIDEGTLVVRRNGAVVARESFSVRGGLGGRLTVAGTVSQGGNQLTPSLEVDSASGAPLAYRLQGRTDAGEETIEGNGRPGRFSTSTRRTGGRAAKEYVLGPLPVLLDEGIYHQYAILGLVGRPDAVSVVVPRRNEQLRGTLRDAGAATVRIDRRDVPARHFVLEVQGGAHEIWVDGARRLLKVAIPALGIEATREELPR